MTQRKFLDDTGTALVWEKGKNKFVAKENGKGLSEANYTQTEKAKLEGIESGAEANVNADWNASTGDAAILNKPGTATTSADGLMSSTDKTKLEGIESGAEANVQADWSETSSSSDAYIANKPTIPTVDTTMSDSSNNAISNATVKSYIDNAIGSITGMEFEVVSSLPATGDAGTIYLVSNSGTSPNSYDEYIWVVVSGTGQFEKIGTTNVDLSGYQLISDLVPISSSDIDTICV